MHLELSEEQRLLADSIERFLRDHYAFERRRELLAGSEPFGRDTWQAFADLGLLALPFAETQGGLGGGAVELLLLAEALGRHLVVEPYFETVILAGGLLAACGGERAAALLEGIQSGAVQGAFAYAERGGGLPESAVATRAQPAAGGWRLAGRKAVVFNGAAADFLLVTASEETEGGAGAPALFLVPGEAPGVHRRPYRTWDGRSACELELAGVELPAEARLFDAAAFAGAWARVRDRALLFLCAEALGGMEGAFAATVEYTKGRVQFGQPLARFQVVRHRLVDMYIQKELARSLVQALAWHLDRDDPAAPRIAAAAKAQLSAAGRFVTENAIQLHGGIAMTDEYHVGHYLKRQAVIDALLGDRAWHLARYRRLADGGALQATETEGGGPWTSS
ncbi:MAG: acyl-CoA dehydrogenase [Porticoccaceae bacterium]|nr:MAG: acyl-CoA dehydrogenase [Porticoccaceae bacterium]